MLVPALVRPLALALLTAGAAFPGAALADETVETPTYFVLEADTGLLGPSYGAGRLGWSYGLGGGVTWRFVDFPLRFAVLAEVEGRSSHAAGGLEGLTFDASRRDTALYLAERTGLPILGPLRVYAEIGFGRRWVSESIARSAIGAVPASYDMTLLVLAFGLEARLSELWSVGLALELQPLSASGDPIASLAHTPSLEPAALVGRVGVHF
jgi:hypothetical protein